MTDLQADVLEQPIASVVETGTDTLLVNTPDNSDAEMAAVYDRLVKNNGADRGEGGKFVSPNGAGDQPGAEADPVVAPPPSPAVTAPAHLPQALKAEWDKMPEAARAEVAKLTTEWDRKFGQLGEQYGAIKPVADKLFDAAKKFPEFAGMNPDQIVTGAISLAAVQAGMTKNPVGTILEVAKTYGIMDKLSAVFTGKEAPAGPDVAGLHREIADLKSRLEKAASPETIRHEISMTMQEKEAERAVADFRKGKDHYEAVESQLPHFLNMVIENGGKGRPMLDLLNDAYDMAINAIPSVREKVRAAEAKATATNPDPKRTADARRAASINVRSITAGSERAMTEEEAMKAAYDRAMAH